MGIFIIVLLLLNSFFSLSLAFTIEMMWWVDHVWMSVADQNCSVALHPQLDKGEKI